MTHVEAVEMMVEALATGPEHAALIEACRALARTVDESGFDDRLWREYRLALKALMDGASGGSDDGDAFDEEFKRMRAAVGDAEES